MTSGLDILDAPSPNFGERLSPVSMIVLHYTGMESGEAALARLRDPEAQVSAHYLIEEDGRIFRLVGEDKRAWHAGRAHWRGIDDVNSASIGTSATATKSSAPLGRARRRCGPSPSRRTGRPASSAAASCSCVRAITITSAAICRTSPAARISTAASSIRNSGRPTSIMPGSGWW